MNLETEAAAELAELEAANRRRRPLVFSGPQRARIQHGGRDLLSFSSNDYLGLADHPRLLQAVRDGLESCGLGAGASRLISGTRELHRAAESALAKWVGLPKALLFSSGYAANLGALQTFLTRGDIVFSDALNHASLIDGCRLSRAQVQPYRHRDLVDLALLLDRQRPHYRRALICTDTVFSMDGDEAPLGELRDLADRYDALLLVDEAHALGVFGPDGRGLCADQGVVPDLLVGTLGKSTGLCGAFVAASASAIELLENRARSYVFSTASPPALAHAIPVAVELCRRADAARHQLGSHARRLREGLADRGFEVLPGRSPILPILVRDDAEVMRLSAALLREGVFVHGIRPPTVPVGTARLRLTLMATHTGEDLQALLRAFDAASA